MVDQLEAFTANRSGSVGNVVHSRNAAGPYTRVRVTPFDPKTPNQARVRARFDAVRSRWTNVLDEAQRGTWADYAGRVTTPGRAGRRNKLSGQMMYVRCNTARIRPFMGFIDSAPSGSSLGSVSPIEVQKTIIPDEVRVIFNASDEWVAQTGAFLIVYLSDTFPLTVNFFAGPFRFAGVIVGNTTTPPPSPFPVVDSWPAVPPAHRWARTRVVFADGRASTPVIAAFKPGFF